jgi:hypothetical protein
VARLRDCLAVLFLVVGAATPTTADAVAVRAVPVDLNPSDPKQVSVGRLRYRGGLWLTADDARFGGFSTLRILPDGPRMVAVSDEGRWLAARLVHDADGMLTGVADAEMGTLQDTEGRPLASKEAADSESMARMPDGSFVVGFEHQHRLWHYDGSSGHPDGPARALPSPAGLEVAPENGGLEAVVALPTGRLLALTEYWIVGDVIRGWFDGPDAWKPLGYRFSGPYRPSDAAVLPSGDVLVLERAYNPQRGVIGIHFRRLQSRRLKKNAALSSELLGTLEPPLLLDNFEGIDCLGAPGKPTVVYVISDDNFNKEQRTLLLKFELE